MNKILSLALAASLIMNVMLWMAWEKQHKIANGATDFAIEAMRRESALRNSLKSQAAAHAPVIVTTPVQQIQQSVEQMRRDQAEAEFYENANREIRRQRLEDQKREIDQI